MIALLATLAVLAATLAVWACWRHGRTIRAELARFKQGVERSGEAIYMTGPDGRVIYVNPAFERANRVRAAEVVGKPPSGVRTGRGSLCASGQEVVRELAGGGRRVVESCATPLTGRGGALVGHIVTERDLTEQRRMVVALRQSEAKFRSLVEDALVGIWVAQGGKFTYANPKLAAILGCLAPWNLLGTPLADLALPNERAALAEDLARGQRVHRTFRGRRRDGEVVHLEVRGTPTEVDGARVVIGTLLDVTATRRAREVLEEAVEARSAKLAGLEEQVRQAQKMEAIGQLAGGVAHDFNNLLAVILNYTRFVRDDLPEGGRARDDLDEATRAAERAAAMTRQLLAFSRRQVLEPRPLRLDELALGMHKMLRRLIREDIQVELQAAPGLWSAEADPGQLEQVLLNLVVNARDAIAGPGRIVIDAANVMLDAAALEGQDGVAPGEFVRLSVRDDGAGMTEEVRRHVFEPFFTTKEVGRGTGLGLATVYGIVKQHGGFVTVASEPGQGSTFAVHLPRTLESDARGIDRAPGGGEGGHEVVLLVEDDPRVRASTGRILSGLGYRVLEASDGEEALRRSEELSGPIHLLLTDVVMPRMSGAEVARRVGAARPGVKVLFMSGYADDPAVEHGILSLGTAFLPKPISRERLARRVRDLLDGRAAASIGS